MAKLLREAFDIPQPYLDGCDKHHKSAELTPCVYGNPSASQQVVLVGDSIAAQWFSALAYNPNWHLTVFTKSACPMVDEPLFYKLIGRRYRVCEQWRHAVIERIQAMQPDLVVLSSTTTYPFTDAQWESGSRRVFKELAATNAQVAIFRSTPNLGLNPMDCLRNKQWQQLRLPAWLNLGTCDSELIEGDASGVYSALARAAKSFDNVTVMDFNHLICPQNNCRAMAEGKIVFRDPKHITDVYVRSMEKEVQRQLLPTQTQ